MKSFFMFHGTRTEKFTGYISRSTLMEPIPGFTESDRAITWPMIMPQWSKPPDSRTSEINWDTFKRRRGALSSLELPKQTTELGGSFRRCSIQPMGCGGAE